MLIYPAIDILDGRCVRLVQGDYSRETVFSDDPVSVARRWVDQGAERIHLVDLDGAKAGRPVNGPVIRRIVESVTVPCQLGGGIRDLATIEMWLGKGVRRVILGTVAVRNPELVREACRQFPGRIAVGIDAKGGKVAVEGWAEVSDVAATDLARRFEDAGVAAIIYTDIERDGAMAGPNVAATAALARAVSLPVIASGGVSSMADLRALKESGAPLDGVIAGRALYEGRLDLGEAVAYLAA